MSAEPGALVQISFVELREGAHCPNAALGTPEASEVDARLLRSLSPAVLAYLQRGIKSISNLRRHDNVAADIMDAIEVSESRRVGYSYSDKFNSYQRYLVWSGGSPPPFLGPTNVELALTQQY